MMIFEISTTSKLENTINYLYEALNLVQIWNL